MSITATFILACDVCGRREEHTASGVVVSPSLPELLASTGWRQFFSGPVACSECSQNYEIAMRLNRIVKEAVSGLPRNSDLLANGEKRRYRFFSDQEILKAMRTYRTNAEAERALGMSHAQYFKRKKRLRNHETNTVDIPAVPAGNGNGG